ncbi:hypothetical protein ACHQM5_002290 [Ranunculus cassubicifolius]
MNHMLITMGLKLLLLLLSWLSVASPAVNQTNTKPGCPPNCGNVEIPYPFGIGANCYIAEWAEVICDTTFNPPKPFIGTVEIVQFSVSEIRVKQGIAIRCFDQAGGLIGNASYRSNLYNTPYTFSSTKNKLFAIGCDTFVMALLNEDNKYWITCTSVCDESYNVTDGSCSGMGCCQTSIPKGLKEISATANSFNNFTNVQSFGSCSAAFLRENDMYEFKVSDFTNISRLPDIPTVVNFAVGNQTCKQAKQNATAYACKENSYCYDSVDGTGYLCSCNNGYEGNPYLEKSCQDVDECEDPKKNPCTGICTNTKGSYTCSCPSGHHGDGAKNGTVCTRESKTVPILRLSLGLGLGFLFLLVGGSWLYLGMKKRKVLQVREKFFQRNGGLVLKQHISSHEGGAESTKIFTSDELKLATNNYDDHRILGQGGSGTVYKGVLPDLRIVAIKKSKIVDESQIGQFINEVVILTQIHHRNVVKLLGCCLETDVPVLVYEFVPNGTLFHHLHKKGGLSWEDRLRIAAETAGALAYLHSAASVPIIHRDVKSANILLDANYTAKVADFGASRLNPLDETQISTLVQGTMGYLDPSYFHSGQLTEKSDVYSFGVVLAELLTGEKPVCSERSQKQRHLTTYFISLMNENNFIHATIAKDGEREQILAVAELAYRCLCVRGDARPSMKEVAAELESLRGFRKHPLVKQCKDETSSLSSSLASYNIHTASGQDSLDTAMMRSMNLPR